MKRIRFFPIFKILFFLLAAGLLGWKSYQWIYQYAKEVDTLKKVVERLSADTRVAEVLVTGVNYDEKSRKTFTTIKFLEYGPEQTPLTPRYFTFSGNIIQFQSLVIRFDDIKIRNGDWLQGKSAHLFWKVFMLDGENTQEYMITAIDEIPEGYKLQEGDTDYERWLWKHFWDFALDPKSAGAQGIKNAQIEAPGTMFVPGNLYTIKIEHDGGLRIESHPLPSILRGETILKGAGF